jgi:hypothetical protein
MFPRSLPDFVLPFYDHTIPCLSAIILESFYNLLLGFLHLRRSVDSGKGRRNDRQKIAEGSKNDLRLENDRQKRGGRRKNFWNWSFHCRNKTILYSLSWISVWDHCHSAVPGEPQLWYETSYSCKEHMQLKCNANEDSWSPLDPWFQSVSLILIPIPNFIFDLDSNQMPIFLSWSQFLSSILITALDPYSNSNLLSQSRSRSRSSMWSLSLVSSPILNCDPYSQSLLIFGFYIKNIVCKLLCTRVIVCVKYLDYGHWPKHNFTFLTLNSMQILWLCYYRISFSFIMK